jgi:outer membrane protein
LKYLNNNKTMKGFRSVILFLVLAMPGYILFAQGDSVMRFSLVDAQNYGISNFYVSKNAKLDIEEAKKIVWQTTAIGLPQVKASASYTYIPGYIPSVDFGALIGQGLAPIFNDLVSNGVLNPDSIPKGGGGSPIAARTSLTYGFTVSQLIFSGEYIVGLQASKVYKLISEQANEKTEIELRKSIADNYYGCLILEKNKMILEQTLNNLKDNLDQQEKTFKSGFIEDIDVDQIRLLVKRTENSLTTLDRQEEVLNKMLKYQLGMSYDQSLELTDSLDNLINLNIINDSEYKFILEDNIDYQILGNREKSMKLLLKREETTFLPTLAVFYQYQDKTNKAFLDFTLNNLIGISINVPIFSSGSRMVTVGAARIEYEKVQNMREQEANRLKMVAQQTLYDYRSAVEKYQNEKENFELSKKVYDKTSIKFKEGTVSSLNLSLINNQFLQAQMSYALAVQELLNAKTALDKAYNKL